MHIYGTDIEIEESLVEILDKDERLRLAKLSVAGNKEENQEARMRLVLSMTKFIVLIATKKYFLRGADLEEAVEESYLSLLIHFSPPLKSKDGITSRFNPDLGYDPITYAGYVINSAIYRFATNHRDIIGIPQHISSRLRALIQELESCEAMTPVEFNKLLKKNEVSKLLLAQYTSVHDPLSLDALLTRAENPDSKNATLMDVVPDKKDLGFDERAFKTLQAQKILQKAFEELKLTEREIKVLKLRYGLDDNVPHSYKEVGRILRITKTRAKQICDQLQYKIRDWLKKEHPEYAEIIKKHLLN